LTPRALGDQAERIGVIDRDDTAVQGIIGDRLAGCLDLGKFWHLLVLLVPVSTGPR
jgi:hypothetical protein